MTLLFYLRSPAGNTDTGQDVGPQWDYVDEREQLKREKKLTAKERRRLKQLAKEAVAKTAEAAALQVIELEKEATRKRIREEEELLMLFMHEFDGYDD